MTRLPSMSVPLLSRTLMPVPSVQLKAYPHSWLRVRSSTVTRM